MILSLRFGVGLRFRLKVRLRLRLIVQQVIVADARKQVIVGQHTACLGLIERKGVSRFWLVLLAAAHQPGQESVYGGAVVFLVGLVVRFGLVNRAGKAGARQPQHFLIAQAAELIVGGGLFGFAFTVVAVEVAQKAEVIVVIIVAHGVG